MGFEALRRTYSLEFEGSAEYDGLIVKCRPPTVGEALENLDLAWLTDDEISDEDRAQRLRDLYETFAGRLVSWNIEIDGNPVPATLDGLLALDHDFGIRIVRNWLFETSAVPRPLDDDSTSGEQSAVESIPMEALSESLAS
jgi:hypothetical protein